MDVTFKIMKVYCPDRIMTILNLDVIYFYNKKVPLKVVFILFSYKKRPDYAVDFIFISI
jgi:hypothetical protein